jgi:hypothetical protein
MYIKTPAFPPAGASRNRQQAKYGRAKYERHSARFITKDEQAGRVGTGAALPLLKQIPPPGGIIGTAYAGFEDCFHFYRSSISEGLLTGKFCTKHTQCGSGPARMLSQNKGYNNTHVHLDLLRKCDDRCRDAAQGKPR